MSQTLAQRLESLPEFMSGHDLIKLGLFKTLNALYVARTRGTAPDHIKIVRKILYPRDAVIEFIKAHTQNGSIGQSSKANE